MKIIDIIIKYIQLKPHSNDGGFHLCLRLFVTLWYRIDADGREKESSSIV